MATILTVTANTLIDHVAMARVEAGAVNRVDRVELVAGGKGINVGRVLARFGHRVIAAGFAGGYTGALLSDLIAGDGMEPALATTAARTRLGFLAVDAERGGSTSLLEGGFTVTPAEVGALLNRIRADLPACDLVIVSGSVPHASCTGLYRQILDACHHAGKPCWIDAYGPAMDEALSCSHPPLLAKPNRSEYHGKDRNHARWQPCLELHISDGASEVRVRTPQGRWRVQPPLVREVNAVGSGDCYLAALAHARLSGFVLNEQLRFAAAAGAANAQRADVARITPSEIGGLIDQVQVSQANEASSDIK